MSDARAVPYGSHGCTAMLERNSTGGWRLDGARSLARSQCDTEPEKSGVGWCLAALRPWEGSGNMGHRRAPCRAAQGVGHLCRLHRHLTLARLHGPRSCPLSPLMPLSPRCLPMSARPSGRQNHQTHAVVRGARRAPLTSVPCALLLGPMFLWVSDQRARRAR